MDDTTKNTLAIIRMITLCLVFLIGAVMLFDALTRRPAEEIKMIEEAKAAQAASKMDACIAGAGIPDFNGTEFVDCKKAN